MSYFPSISQNVTVDTANSASTTLSAGSTWNSSGTGTSTLGVNAIQVMVKSDQNMTVYVDQGRTNSTFQITDTYRYNALQNNFGITVQAVAAYVRVRVKNDGSSTATFTVDTILCPIVEALPRSLDEHGHLQVAAGDLSDYQGNKVKINPQGMMNVDQPYRLVGPQFGLSLDTTFWTASNSGTGSAAGVASSIATLTSGTANSGYGQITTVRSGRLIFGMPNRFRALLRMTALTKADNVRRWGAYSVSTNSPVDGFYFELDGSDVLSVNYRNNGGTVTTVSSGSFNGDVSTYAMDTNAHAYEISYYLAKAIFSIDGVIVHTFTPTTAQMASTYSLPATFASVNSAGGTVSATMEVFAGAIYREGMVNTAPRTVFTNTADTATVLKSSAGTLRRIIYGKMVNGASISVYDALSATNQILLISPPNGTTTGTILCDIDFYTGLTYTTSNAGMGVTFVFE